MTNGDEMTIQIVKFFKRMRRYNGKYFLHKLYDLKVRKIVEGAIDSRQFHRLHPEFDRLHSSREKEYRDRIYPYYEKYIHGISSEIMAVSLELCLFLFSLCEFRRPARILDLGSGFSSFVFRLYAEGADPKPEVWSVDDSTEWLEKTRSFLAEQGMPASNLSTWEEFIARDAGRFDLVLYDISGFDFRRDNFTRVLDYAGDDAFVIVDDMHAAEYGRYVTRHLRENDIRHFSAWPYTNDKYGRYCFLVEPG